MSINWATIKPVLKDWAKTRSGLKAAVWREEERPMIDGPIVLLNILATAGLGADEVRWDMDETAPAVGEEIIPRVVGSRRFTWSIAVENYISQKPTDFADFYLERMRTRLRMPSSHAIFLAAGIALVETKPIQVLDYGFDGRQVSAASMDVVMATGVDEADVPTGYIESVAVSSTLKDEAGVVLPVPPNLDEEVMP